MGEGGEQRRAGWAGQVERVIGEPWAEVWRSGAMRGELERVGGLADQVGAAADGMLADGLAGAVWGAMCAARYAVLLRDRVGLLYEAAGGVLVGAEAGGEDAARAIADRLRVGDDGGRASVLAPAAMLDVWVSRLAPVRERLVEAGEWAALAERAAAMPRSLYLSVGPYTGHPADVAYSVALRARDDLLLTLADPRFDAATPGTNATLRAAVQDPARHVGVAPMLEVWWRLLAVPETRLDDLCTHAEYEGLEAGVEELAARLGRGRGNAVGAVVVGVVGQLSRGECEVVLALLRSSSGVLTGGQLVRAVNAGRDELRERGIDPGPSIKASPMKRHGVCDKLVGLGLVESGEHGYSAGPMAQGLLDALAARLGHPG